MADAKAQSKKVYALVELMYQGSPLGPVGTELQDKLPEDVLEMVLERGEASHTKPKE